MPPHPSTVLQAYDFRRRDLMAESERERLIDLLAPHTKVPTLQPWMLLIRICGVLLLGLAGWMALT
jgi:hypothetical protein